MNGRERYVNIAALFDIYVFKLMSYYKSDVIIVEKNKNKMD